MELEVTRNAKPVREALDKGTPRLQSTNISHSRRVRRHVPRLRVPRFFIRSRVRIQRSFGGHRDRGGSIFDRRHVSTRILFHLMGDIARQQAQFE